MNDSNTNAVDPRDDRSDKAMLDQDITKPAVNDPDTSKTAPAVTPGPDTREENVSPK